MSKIETGAQLPTSADILKWLEAADALQEMDVLEELRRRARVTAVSHQQAFVDWGGAAGFQRRIHRDEKDARKIADFCPTVIPGLLQTASYARKIISLPGGAADLGNAAVNDVEHMVAARIERQETLYDLDKTLSFVLTEAVLWSHFGDLDIQLEQLVRLESLVSMRTIDLRILPFSARLPVLPLNMFRIYDDDRVLIETLTQETVLLAREEVGTYKRFFDYFQAAALSGEDAKMLLRRISEQLANTPESDVTRAKST